MIPRLQLFEFGDQHWLPPFLRSFLGGLLNFQVRETYSPAVPKIKQVLEQCRERTIVDLCSGQGGAWPVLLPALVQELSAPVRLILTDKYPQPGILRQLPETTSLLMHYYPEPVDARFPPETLAGLRTIFTGFHHFSPVVAQGILRTAVEQQVPIAVFEFTRRRWTKILGMLLAPVAVWLITPMLRPFRWSRLIWTYLVPVVPLIYTWDGLVSHLRTYSVAELESMVRSLPVEGYHWEVGLLPNPQTGEQISYLIGYSRQ